MTGADPNGDAGAGRVKAPQAFRTIREVSDSVGVPPHILRFWETRFPQLKPMQRGGNRRYYRPADVALAHALRRLLHEEGYTVKGVQKLIATEGLAAVVARGADDADARVAPAPVAVPSPASSGPHVPPNMLPTGIWDELRAIRERLAVALTA